MCGSVIAAKDSAAIPECPRIAFPAWDLWVLENSVIAADVASWSRIDGWPMPSSANLTAVGAEAVARDLCAGQVAAARAVHPDPAPAS